MRFYSTIHRVAPFFKGSFATHIPWKGKRHRLAISFINNNAYFAFTVYVDSRPIANLGIYER